ncbi:GNAT family N-acetyltransferase [Lentilactobacillus kisonensis]|uniref:Acetyltransferase, GNAT family n=1 Tax=Lentilactobacillus kisonensis DSM 19906 = JCM 15041 TaxID=1423766 RepID=A0A0R1P047_9LACO|nr:GNAT family N-acetyltransferase [Lentilactobacillus kisonensis]KRL22515.1 acetyltransferase, GNAT family [Lentilactobacillus kisonensis DSM 19906 = JCM 15041]
MDVKETDQLDKTYNNARLIRRHVFVAEQGIDEHDEFDGTDSQAVHFVAYVNSKPVATARTTVTDEGVHIQRVATEKKFRHSGYAKQLLRYILNDDRFSKASRFYLGAQETAVGFYKTLGFHTYGEPFMEVGIKHWQMSKSV